MQPCTQHSLWTDQELTESQALDHMREGATLHVGWGLTGKYFWLNPGGEVDNIVGEGLILHQKVIAAPDSMFGVVAQTYIHKDFIHKDFL